METFEIHVITYHRITFRKSEGFRWPIVRLSLIVFQNLNKKIGGEIDSTFPLKSTKIHYKLN